MYAWKLVCDRGRQVWKYVGDGKGAAKPLPDYDKKKNPNSSDLVYRTARIAERYQELKDLKELPADAPLPARAEQAAMKGINFYQALQDDDGHWPGDYAGPMFLMPGLIITMYVTGTPLPEEHKKEMIRYLRNRQHADGGWGIHIEGHSTMFGTVLQYVALRLLGVKADDPDVEKARAFIHHHGAFSLPSWGKFWLAVLGVADWRGINTMVPELWMLPSRLPFHPSKWWCHCRMVYLPMAYIYGHRVTGEITPLVQELRRELYNNQPFETIEWEKHRNTVCKLDLYTPQSRTLKLLYPLANLAERFIPKFIRKKSCDWILSYIHAEDEQTNHVDIGPVNKVINMLAVWHAEGPRSKNFLRHHERIFDYLWLAEDGMKMQGYNGSQLWDTSFATRAICETGLTDHFEECLRKVYKYVECAQVIEETPDRERWFRQIAQGAWPFSTRDHGWPIADCTSEGLSAALLIHSLNIIPEKERLITDERIFDAVNVLLNFQNKDGGVATYELMRSGAYMEAINPAEVFAGIMVDYPYVECTSACVQALLKFKKYYPRHRTAEIDRFVRRAVGFIKSIQRKDGSWYGSWAVCFTYGGWFGVEGLIDAGERKDSPAIRKACEFLLSKQRPDGGWGESYKSCETKQWSEHEESQVVNTAWAVMTLCKAEWPDMRPIEKGVQLLLSRQLKNGDWNQEAISGVFNGNCMITYTAYRNVFPIWAIGRYMQYAKKRRAEA